MCVYTGLVNTEVGHAQYDGAGHELGPRDGSLGEGSTRAGRDFACEDKTQKEQ